MDRFLERRVAIHLVDVGQIGHAGFQRFVQGYQQQVARIEDLLAEVGVVLQAFVLLAETVAVAAEEQGGQCGRRVHVEGKSAFVARGFLGKQAVGDQGVVQVAVLAVLGAARVAEVGDDFRFRIEAGVVRGAGAAAPGLHVGMHGLAQRGEVGKLAHVFDQAAAHRVALAAGDQVAADTGGSRSHPVSDVVTHGQRGFAVAGDVQAAGGKTAQLGAEVDVIGRGCGDALVGKGFVKATDQGQPLRPRRVLRQGHGHPHVNELLGFVFLPGGAVLQAVFAANVMQGEMRGLIVARVVNHRLQRAVFLCVVGQWHHHAVIHHARVQFGQGGDAGAVDQLVQVGGIQTPGHPVIGPGFLVQAVLDEFFLQLDAAHLVWHRTHHVDDDAAPVHLVAEGGGGPFAPAVELAGNVGLAVAVTFEDGAGKRAARIRGYGGRWWCGIGGIGGSSVRFRHRQQGVVHRVHASVPCPGQNPGATVRLPAPARRACGECCLGGRAQTCGDGRSESATRFPAEAVTCTGQLVQSRSRASHGLRPGRGPMCRQVFGLADAGLGPPTWLGFPGAAPQCRCCRSFPLTAAGQFRIYTGFPFQPAPPIAGVGTPTRTTYGAKVCLSTQNVRMAGGVVAEAGPGP